MYIASIFAKYTNNTDKITYDSNFPDSIKKGVTLTELYSNEEYEFYSNATNINRRSV